MTLAQLASCPHCHGSLSFEKSTIHCGTCQRAYPYVDGMPWLFVDPEAALAEWRGRLKHLLQHLEGEAEHLKGELKRPLLSDLTQKRLRKVLQAKVEHRKNLEDLLKPMQLSANGSLETSRALKSRLPLTQSITGYYTNIHRDWAWGDEENEAAYRCVEAVLKDNIKLGRLLVLGAGAARLAYDLHKRLKPDVTVAVDINPLMFIVAKRLLKGRSVKLYEFPIAPLDLDSHAILRRCVAPEPIEDGFELVFSDAAAPAFRPGSFDTILTPWIIDIVPQRLEEFAPIINKLLKPQGRWINSGSLAFQHVASAFNYSFEETLDVIATKGFEIQETKRQRIPYMCSPASHHGRMETVVSFVAQKRSDTPAAPKQTYLPGWLTDSSLPIPRLREYDVFTTMHSVLLDVVSLIDGQRSLKEIALIFGHKYGMQAPEAQESIRGFLVKHYEENLR